MRQTRILFCCLIFGYFIQSETHSTYDPELMLSNSNYDPDYALNVTTLHGGEEHNRFGNFTGIGAGAGRLTDEQILLQVLLDNYERSARPVLHKTGRVTVGLGLTITQIFELDERNEVLITNVWLDQEWFDEYLRWDPKNFTGISMMRIPSSKIWLPDIVLYNNAADYSTRIVDSRAMVSSNGYVFWPLPTKLYSSCKVDVKYFPFDEQVCHMKFGSWTYDGFKVDLTNRTEGADLSMYIENGEWTLIAVQQRRNVVIYTCCEEPYPDVTFYVYIKRKTLYYLHNVFFPCFVMSTLTVLVFLLPPDSGEKCALGITVMLAFAVFMLTVIEKLPETSESVPLISIYLTVVMSMTAVSVILTVIVLNLHHKTARSWRLAPWVVRALDRIAPVCCLNGEPKNANDVANQIDQEIASVCGTDNNNNADPQQQQDPTSTFSPPPYGWSVPPAPPSSAVNLIKSPSQRSAMSIAALSEMLECNEVTGSVRHTYSVGRMGSIRNNSSSNRQHVVSNTTAQQVIRLSSTEFLQELESEMDALDSNYLSPTPHGLRLAPDHALALAVIRMMDRHRGQTKTEFIIRDWRRLAEVCDRFLFWLFFFVVTFFTLFILVFAPNERLL